MKRFPVRANNFPVSRLLFHGGTASCGDNDNDFTQNIQSTPYIYR
jgi:hypothetical protein